VRMKLSNDAMEAGTSKLHLSILPTVIQSDTNVIGKRCRDPVPIWSQLVRKEAIATG
jgi:hypothetical protein